MTTEHIHELDVRRLLCPMPVIKTQQKAKALSSGEKLRVIATDPGALHDIPAWCRMYGHRVLDAHSQSNEVIITIEIV